MGSKGDEGKKPASTMNREQSLNEGGKDQKSQPNLFMRRKRKIHLVRGGRPTSWEGKRAMPRQPCFNAS